MASAIGDTFPLGLGIALNPIVVVVILLILSRANSRRNGLVFTLGWILGLALLVVLGARLVQVLMAARRGLPSDIGSLLWIGLGVLLYVAAAGALRNRPLLGEEPAPARWMRIIDRGGVGHVLGLGAFLAMVSLRNLVLLAAAASVIGQAALPGYGTIVAVAIFVAISTLGILITLLVHLFGGRGADAMLAAWGKWLSRNMGAITAVVMILLGTVFLGKGIGGFF